MSGGGAERGTAGVAGREEEVRRYYRTVSRFIDRERLARPDRELWRRLAAEHAGGWGLDLGCGTGRVTLELAGSLAGVVGVDLSPEMIGRARRRLRGARAWLVVADMRSLTLARRFDLITAANDPFAHLSGDRERDRTLAVVAAHLAAGGRFVLDAHWFRPDRLEQALSEPGLVVEHRGRGLDVRESWRCDREGGCSARYEYRRAGELVGEAEFRSRHWSIEEVRSRFARAGLEITALWGDFSRSPWHPETSRHLVVAAGPASGSGPVSTPPRGAR